MNVARAAKALGRPVIATGFIGGRKGDQIVSDLNDEGILCDFVRVAGESRISTAVVDRTTGVVTEINEQGPDLSSEDLSRLHEKLEYLGKAADAVVFGGSIPPGLDDDCYAGLIEHVRSMGLTSFFSPMPIRCATASRRARLCVPQDGRGGEDHRVRVRRCRGPVGGGAHPARDGGRFGGNTLPLRLRGAVGQGWGQPVLRWTAARSERRSALSVRPTR